MSEKIVEWRKNILSPVKGSQWASEMVLNPAIIRDPKTNKIHMLFRASGPCSAKAIPGKPLPYPIFLGYGVSEDGSNFTFDLKTPALSPAVYYEKEKMILPGGKINFANGCLEDPRLMIIDGVCYLTVACRMFPPGPYWEKDDPLQCMPEWAKDDGNPYGTADNPTVTVLYRVDLDALGQKDYGNAFEYVTNLTNPIYGQDRDVVFFSKRMMVNGSLCYVMIHRPVTPDRYPGITESRPSMFIAAAKDFSDFAADRCVERKLLLAPFMNWQENRIGASAPPLELDGGRWLLNYHGKQDDIHGYGQSFMTFIEKENALPEIEKICNEKLIVNTESFEQPSKFGIPCIFNTGMVSYDGGLLISYGAADENVGLMKINLSTLMDKLNTIKT